MHWTLNENEIGILKLLVGGDNNISTISGNLDISTSWTSECVSHLRKMGLVEQSRTGITLKVILSNNILGESLRKLIVENKQLNLKRTLGDSSLLILPYLLSKGNTMRDIARWSSISYRTVLNYIGRWSRMGVAYRQRGGYCIMNPLMRDLKEFVIHFIQFHNRDIGKEITGKGVILWQQWEEFLFSNDKTIDKENVFLAGPSELEDLGLDLVVNREYMMYSKRIDSITPEEAIVQTILIDPVNPRPRRILKRALISGLINKEYLLDFADKYDIKKEIEDLVM